MTYSGDSSQNQVNTTQVGTSSVSDTGEMESSIGFDIFPGNGSEELQEPGYIVEEVAGKVWVWDGEKWVLQFDKSNIIPAERGPQGQDGPEGPSGPDGPIGATGPTGPPGRGDTGPKGATGDDGRTGATGAMGAAICENIDVAPNSGIRGKLYIDKYNQIYITLG